MGIVEEIAIWSGLMLAMLIRGDVAVFIWRAAGKTLFETILGFVGAVIISLTVCYFFTGWAKKLLDALIFKRFRPRSKIRWRWRNLVKKPDRRSLRSRTISLWAALLTKVLGRLYFLRLSGPAPYPKDKGAVGISCIEIPRRFKRKEKTRLEELTEYLKKKELIFVFLFNLIPFIPLLPTAIIIVVKLREVKYAYPVLLASSTIRIFITAWLIWEGINLFV